jgi:hypothetical protein
VELAEPAELDELPELAVLAVLADPAALVGLELDLDDDEQPRRNTPRPTDITPATARFMFSARLIDGGLRTLCRILSASV